MFLRTTSAVFTACFASFLFCRVVNGDGVFGALKIASGKSLYDSDSCPALNPKYPVLLPDPEDCSKFYICDSGSRYLKECQAGLHFNPNIKACDYPERAGCDKDFTKDEPKIPEGKIGDDTHLCPAKNSAHPVLLPHPTDCNKFYICDKGTAHLKACQEGLHFNSKIKACDYPINAACDKDEVKTPKGKVGDDTRLCPAENSAYPVLLPHPTDCNKFYICDRGSPRSKTCQEGLHFNPKIKACDYPENSGCDVGLTYQEAKTENRMVDHDYFCPASKNSGPPIIFPDPKECSKFFMCHGEEIIPFACPQGLHFNSKMSVCDFPSNAACDEKMMYGAPGIPSEFCPSRNGKIPIFFRHETNCSVYYMCGNGLAYEFVCPARLHFNIRKGVCDYEKNAGCQNYSS